MSAQIWRSKVADKLAKSGIRLPLAENPESFATQITKLEDPFPLYPSLSAEDVAWISAYSTDYTESRLFADLYCKTSGLDERLFKKAAFYAGQVGRFDPTYGKLVTLTYFLLANTTRQEPERIRPFISNNGEISAGRLEKFGFYWLTVGDNRNSGYPEQARIRAGFDREQLELFIDAPIGITITYQGVENAISSFWPEGADTLMIRQIQGVRKKKFKGHLSTGRHHSRGLFNFDFRKTIVDFVSALASEAGFGKIGIQGSLNSAWTVTDDDGRPHITLDQAVRLYDETARRLGFDYNRNGNWYRQIDKTES